MTQIIKAGSAIALLTLLGCSASSKTTEKIETIEMVTQEITTYKVGDQAFGGTVFIVNEAGTHGLVCANQDQFANSSYNECSDMMNNPVYHDATGKNYFDWRLPKVWEANKMYLALHVINQGGFSNSGYWTSQGPSSFEKMSLVNFSNGLEFTSLKSDTYRARAVRAF
ncbi:MAG: hypothetical protein ACI857_001584 [Arenicella sp.]|jgi:hypothetical protein